MEERFNKIKRLQRELAYELQSFMADCFTNAADPAAIIDFAQRLGMDISAAQRTVPSTQPTFDPYRILGCDRSMLQEQVRRRYLDLLRKLHPDTAGIKGTEYLTQLVTEAFRKISSDRRW
ncbi:DnaJ domain-containing protein [Dehalogenimonas formicexedens]|uniref:DnaJ domain-containing protein n=1 Tax=Dehalogenimonas formicexedens TaxID=1839801 RepID=A0A1P8F5C3_9CHLR|nr:J domain-containing protein [Dehalogenimonas formicexedens]APV43628.1 DnaJ domain-containing protein [Dehalogenimonas formicexedens]